MREVVVAGYLLRSRLPSFPPSLGFALLIASLTILPLTAPSWWAKGFALFAAAYGIVACSKRSGDVLLNARVREFLQDPNKGAGKRLGLWNLEPRGLLEGATHAEPVRSFPAGAAYLLGLGSQIWIVITMVPLPPARHIALAFASSVLVAGAARFIAQSADVELRDARVRQRAWLALASAVQTLENARMDDPSPDTDRWASWLLSPHRDPAAPCPELDAKWNAANARE